MTFSKYDYLKSLHGVRMPSDSYYRVIVTLLDHAQGDGTDAYPGNELLAVECCCSTDTVKRALSWAKEQGLIVLVRQGRRNVGATVWRFPQRGKGAPLKGGHRGADGAKSAGSQGGTGAPPTYPYQTPGAKTPRDGLRSGSGEGRAKARPEPKSCRECGATDFKHSDECPLSPWAIRH